MLSPLDWLDAGMGGPTHGKRVELPAELAAVAALVGPSQIGGSSGVLFVGKYRYDCAKSGCGRLGAHKIRPARWLFLDFPSHLLALFTF